MIKVGLRVEYIREDTFDDKESGFYPPIGTCGTVVSVGSNTDIQVKWDNGTNGDGVWWCEITDVKKADTEQFLKELIEEKVDQIFLAYQNANGITNGDIEPMDALKLDHIEEMLKSHIEYVCEKQKGSE